MIIYHNNNINADNASGLLRICRYSIGCFPISFVGYLKLSESEKSKDSLGSSNSPPLPDSFALMTSSGKASATRVLSFQSV